MLPRQSSKKLEQHFISSAELYLHGEYKKRGLEYFNILKRQRIVEEKTTNEILLELSKDECIEQLRTVFVDYMYWCPPYSTIENALEKHCENCPLANHWFFEGEPICTTNMKSTLQSSFFVCDILDCYRYIQHQPRKKKIEMIQNNLFNFVGVDMCLIRINLSPPYFEYSLFALITYMHINGISHLLKTIHFENYKIALLSHLNKCKGPCKLNVFGFPICLLSENDAKKILKMMSCFVMLGRPKMLKNNEKQEHSSHNKLFFSSLSFPHHAHLSSPLIFSFLIGQKTNVSLIQHSLHSLCVRPHPSPVQNM